MRHAVIDNDRACAFVGAMRAGAGAGQLPFCPCLVAALLPNMPWCEQQIAAKLHACLSGAGGAGSESSTGAGAGGAGVAGLAGARCLRPGPAT